MKRCIGSLLLVFLLPALWAQDRKNAQTYFEAAEQAYLEGRYTEALAQYDKCLVVNAGYYDAYTSRAAVKERLGNWSGAVVDYSIYLDKYPHNKEALFSRGLASYHAGQFVSALDDLNQFLLLPSTNETKTIFYRQSPLGGGTDQIITANGAIRDYVFNYMGLAAIGMKTYELAVAHFDSAIRLNSNEPDYYVHRGLAKQNLGDSPGAEADYRRALALNPDHSIAYHNLGVLLAQRGDDGAEAQLSQAIERNPELSYPFLERGYYRQERGNLKGALSDYTQALKLDPDNPDSWINRGLVKGKLQDLDGAFRDFTRAIELQPSLEKAWFCRGNILAKLNRLEEAIEDYSVALLYYPEYVSAYFNRAVAYHRIGRIQDACSDVQKAESLGFKGALKLKSSVCR